jgi:hypothetical protein
MGAERGLTEAFYYNPHTGVKLNDNLICDSDSSERPPRGCCLLEQPIERQVPGAPLICGGDIVWCGRGSSLADSYPAGMKSGGNH